MKLRWLVVLALVLTLTIVWVSGAFADNGPHGGYTSTTDACAGCHRAHTGVGPSLLVATTSYALCMTCHGVTSGGAGTDVLDGLWVTGGANTSLKGGGFAFARMDTNLDGASTSAATVSQHRVNGMTGYTGDTIWGIGALNSGAGTTFTLECHTCHNPHGRSGATNEATYRILRASPKMGAGGPTLGGTALTVSDVTTKTYTVSSATRNYYGQNYPAASDNDADNGKIATISTWCARCHTRIHATGAGSGSTNPSGDSIYNYRHRTDGSNISSSDANGAPACLTCHVVHGTSAAMGTYSGAVLRPGGTTAMGSSLLRLDNRGVCQACHNK
ncbi:MAG: cytochrome c3 family protein [Chloroflexi bacterium]|nr:cytochrome c3 family protein [Chloroflexota bacterium]